MKLTQTALALALSTIAFAAPAAAQEKQAAQAPQAQPPCNFGKISSGARKPVVELQAAVTAKDAASIPAKVAAASAAAKTADDRCTVAFLQLQAAMAANDNAAFAAAAEALVASRGLTRPALGEELLTDAGVRYYNSKQYAQAASAFQRVVTLNPNNTDAYGFLAKARAAQGQPAEALAMLQQAIAKTKAAGRPVPESMYKDALAIAYKAKNPAALQLSRDWAGAYPSKDSWHDAVAIYQVLKGGNETSLDLYRLMRAAGAMNTENDYYRYANAALVKGLPGEAKAVLDEGAAAGKIDKSAAAISGLYSNAVKKAALDKPTLAGAEKSAMAAATAKPAMVTGDAYLSYGDNAKAAALYRAALGKSGADTGLANLRLGIALARSGDAAGATAAFNAVTGPNAEIAKYWLLYLGKRG